MVKVSAPQRIRMQDYVISRLEDSGIYVTKRLSEDSLLLDVPRIGKTALYLHTDTEGAKNFNIEQVKVRSAGQSIANVFFKDEKTFFVPLTERERIIFGRTTNSHYSSREMYQMVKLMQKEADVLDLQRNRTLTYYQPETISRGGRLEEGIVNFDLSPITTNYENTDLSKAGYYAIAPQNGDTLKRRVLSSNKRNLQGKLVFIPSVQCPKLMMFSVSQNTSDGQKNQKSFSEQIGMENILEFLRQTGTSLDDWGGNIEDIEPYINP